MGQDPKPIRKDEPRSPLNPLQCEIVRRRAEGQRPFLIAQDLRVSKDWVNRVTHSEAGKAEIARLTQIREDVMTEGWRKLSELDERAIAVVKGCLNQAIVRIENKEPVTPAQIHAAEKHLDRRGYKAEDQSMGKESFDKIHAFIEMMKAKHKARQLEKKTGEREDGTSNVGEDTDPRLVTEESHE